MNVSRVVFFGLFLISCAFLIFFKSEKDKNDESYVNVYGWYGIIPRDVIKDFEKEYNIKVRYDVYDNNDVLEAKLLATNSGYDVVFPSFIPYAARQVCMGVYKKTKGLVFLSNNVSSTIREKFMESGGNKEYLIPIFWGTTGIAIEKNTVRKILPEIESTSYDLVLKEENIKKLSICGVSFPEEFADIFPQALDYLGLPSNSKNPEHINEITSLFKHIRKYISKFSSSTLINDLLTGTVCVAIGSSDNAYRAMRASETANKSIEYILPKKGAVLWIDCVAIPSSAPHPRNAGKFIDFLLRPKVAARITEFSGILVTVKGSNEYFPEDIKNNKAIYPDDETVKSLLVGNPNFSENERKFDRLATRAWSQIKMNMFDNINKRNEK